MAALPSCRASPSLLGHHISPVAPFPSGSQDKGHLISESDLETLYGMFDVQEPKTSITIEQFKVCMTSIGVESKYFTGSTWDKDRLTPEEFKVASKTAYDNSLNAIHGVK